MRRLLYIVPAVVFLVIAGVLAIGLTRDPSELPSALLDRPAPDFALPPLPGRDDHGFARSDLGGEPMLVNVFASWCVPCRVEHPLINRLAEEGITVHGINHKDQAVNAQAWLEELGDNFTHVGFDLDGRGGIEWGVYGVPETYIVDAEGTIVHRHVGPLRARDVERDIRPILESLKR
jgi:cytochrome c biogenesis protein CcmG, thiol:disulfide interchange protein DsbE